MAKSLDELLKLRGVRYSWWSFIRWKTGRVSHDSFPPRRIRPHGSICSRCHATL